MKFKYKNYELVLDEDIEALQAEIEQLTKLNNLIDESDNFYLLTGKTQLIGKNKVDNTRSRKEHSDNIVILAKRFIRSLYEVIVDDEIKESPVYQLNLLRELLYTQISAKVHDWGHTPFGHLGERVINHLLQNSSISEENLKKILDRKEQIYGKEYEIRQGHVEGVTKKISFEHNEQSAKILYDFVHQSDIDLNKINLQRIIDTILAHSTSRVKQEFIPNDIVTQIVRQADKLEEYITNDFEEIKDLLNLDVILDKNLRSFLELPKEERIKFTLQQLLNETLEKGYIDDEMGSLEYSRKMKRIHHKYIFMMDTDGKKGLLTGENEERITLMLEKIFNYYIKNKEKIPDRFSYIVRPIKDNNLPKRLILARGIKSNDIALEERVVDYICMMDNEKVERCYYELVRERLLKGEGFGINPITIGEIEESKKRTLEKEVNFKKLKEGAEGVEHSIEECATSLKEEIKGAKRNCLTSKARKRMEDVRKSHQEENQKDVELCKLVMQYDNVQNGMRKKANEQHKRKKVEAAKNAIKEESSSDWETR